VVNYKVTASLDKIDEIKPGMTANMIVLVGQKDNALAIPERAVIDKGNGQKVVRVIDDTKKKTYHEATVTTGMEADGGLVEILSGLNQSQEIVSLIKP
jgi:multidrug efflux pump subunit AcrA (membrane-fusion protein)